jgi:hypothetical protein
LRVEKRIKMANKEIDLIMPKWWIKESLKQGWIQETNKQGIYNYYGYNVAEDRYLPSDKNIVFGVKE